MSVDFEIKAGKIYYLPDGKYVPRTSIVHRQKKQEGFFMHPVLVLLVNGTHVHFYALTRVPPPAIRDLNMCMRIGSTTVDEGPDVLKLAETSGPMSHETWVNLDQRYKMEKQYLKQWSVDVELDAREVAKLQTRIDWLEAQQNRFIYKPLERDLSTVEPGTVLLLLNPRGAPTLGAPVVIFKTCYPWFLYLRVKQMRRNDRAWRDPDGCVHARRMRLAITREPGPGHDDDDTPAMLLTDDSPDFREPSLNHTIKSPQDEKKKRPGKRNTYY
ncbi:hypothetical protein K504DRAFT_472150 [Pleomassaria siparia CBS 279.74]|uniref:Uncharacterized protein n=1 Tax=Pleomassaria siparia CBS 279.74 TaxID=1314801 RepID=A0A6G1JWC5_9PLEO|nr:hypothetical protein K504DRAFT_472150 [Pleomassaria siparia CBS 279.74]